MKLKSTRAYLKPLKSSHFRHAVLVEVRKRLKGTYMNSANREALADATFIVENELEHRRGRNHPIVTVLRNIRNKLYDDLGWNQPSNAPQNVSMPERVLLKSKTPLQFKRRKETKNV